MRSGKIANAVLPLAAVAVLCILPHASLSADATAIGPAEIEYSLTFAPSMPSPGQEIVVSLAGRGGRPAIGPIRWTLSGSGSPFANAGVKGQDGLQYAFTPKGPGSYTIQAEFQDARGMYIASSLEIAIGGATAAQGVISQGTYPQIVQPQVVYPQAVPLPPVAAPAAAAGQPGMDGPHLGVNPSQPRVGQPVAFTFFYGEPIPNGAEVRWDVSGGATSSTSFSGRHKEVATFVPGGQGPFMVRAELYCALGNLLAQVTLGFIAVP